MDTKKIIKDCLRSYISESFDRDKGYNSISEMLDDVFFNHTIELIGDQANIYVDGELLMIKRPNTATFDNKVLEMIEEKFYFENMVDLRYLVKKWVLKTFQSKGKGQHFGVNFDGFGSPRLTNKKRFKL